MEPIPSDAPVPTDNLTTPAHETDIVNKVNRGDHKWMKDKEAKTCKRCNIDFHSVKRRKHHCRMCGYVVCDKCSRNRVQLKTNGKKSRVCGDCFNQIAPRHMRSVSSRSSMTPTPTHSFKNNLISIHDHNEFQQKQQQQQSQQPPLMDNDDEEQLIIHEAVTTDEVDEIIEKLAKVMQQQNENIPNGKPTIETNSSMIRNASFPQRSNTEGTMVEYEVEHKTITPITSKDDDHYPYESPSQPLLNNNESNKCCKCIIL